MKWLLDLIEGKNKLVPFNQSNNFGVVDVKMNRSYLYEKLSSCSKLVWDVYSFWSSEIWSVDFFVKVFFF